MKHNVNRPGGAASGTAALPDWLAVYPGARKSPKGKISWSFQPTAEFVTGDPIRRVYEYYRSAVRGAGATITSEGLMQSGKPPKDFSAHIKALRGDDDHRDPDRRGDTIQLRSLSKRVRGCCAAQMGEVASPVALSHLPRFFDLSSESGIFLSDREN